MFESLRSEVAPTSIPWIDRLGLTHSPDPLSKVSGDDDDDDDDDDDGGVGLR